MNELLIVDKQLTPEEKPSIKREMEIIEDDSFNYDGYQVVRGEFFSHLYEPCITFNNFKVYMNTACIKKTARNRLCADSCQSGEKEAGCTPLFRRIQGLLPLVQRHCEAHT